MIYGHDYPTTVSHPIPGNDDAVKSIRIIVETVTAAIQSGLGQRDTRRAQRGAADIKASQAGVVEEAPAAPVVVGEEVDLSGLALPVDAVAMVEGEIEGGALKKKVVRAKRPAVKAE